MDVCAPPRQCWNYSILRDWSKLIQYLIICTMYQKQRECHRNQENTRIEISLWVKQLIFATYHQHLVSTEGNQIHFFNTNAQKGHVIFTAMPCIMAITSWNSNQLSAGLAIKAGEERHLVSMTDQWLRDAIVLSVRSPFAEIPISFLPSGETSAMLSKKHTQQTRIT